MLASCLWAPGEATSTSLAGQAECCPNHTVSKIGCEIRQSSSSTQTPKQESNKRKLKHCSLQLLAELAIYQALGLLLSPHSNVANMDRYILQPTGEGPIMNYCSNYGNIPNLTVKNASL